MSKKVNRRSGSLRSQKSTQLDSTLQRLYHAYESAPAEASFGDGAHPLPSWSAVERISKELFEISFPGLLLKSPKSPDFYDVITQKLAGLRTLLSEQVICSLRCQSRSKRRSSFYRKRADAVVDRFLKSIPGVINTLWVDAQEAHKKDPASLGCFEIITISPGFFAIALYRHAHELYQLGAKFLARMLSELAHSKTGVDIHAGATIGKGFFIDHGTGVVIGETAWIGEYVTLYHGVTLGVLRFDCDADGNIVRGRVKRRHPKLNDHVTVYAHATILGGDTEVGRNSKVGANVRLIESIGPEMLAGIDRSNIRITPRQKLGSNAEQRDKLKSGPLSQAHGADGYDFHDRVALSRLCGEGGNNCGDVDVMDWPIRSEYR